MYHVITMYFSTHKEKRNDSRCLITNMFKKMLFVSSSFSYLLYYKYKINSLMRILQLHTFFLKPVLKQWIWNLLSREIRNDWIWLQHWREAEFIDLNTHQCLDHCRSLQGVGFWFANWSRIIKRIFRSMIIIVFYLKIIFYINMFKQ